MSTAVNTEFMVIDLKKNRIRIRKSTLHAVGDPPYIQLMFNPISSVVAIRCVDRPEKGGQETRIDWNKLSQTDTSFEMYSQPLMEEIAKTTTALSDGKVYRLAGSIYPRDRVVSFPLSSLQVLE